MNITQLTEFIHRETGGEIPHKQITKVLGVLSDIVFDEYDSEKSLDGTARTLWKYGRKRKKDVRRPADPAFDDL